MTFFLFFVGALAQQDSPSRSITWEGSTSASYVKGRGKPSTWLPRQKLAEVEQEAKNQKKAREKQGEIWEARESYGKQKKCNGETKKT